MRASLGLLAAMMAVTLGAGGCGGSANVFRIGVVVDCDGVFSAFTDPVLAAAELPLLERGGQLAGRDPAAGVRGAKVGGRRVEIRQGCGEFGFLTQLIENVRRLVEADRVDAVIAPLLGNADGIVVRELARRYPNVAFLAGWTGAQETTMRHPAANLFRFGADAAQAQAGLGSYAYRDLGWRRAAVVFSDDQLGWPQAAGFVAEFCSLGGVVQRLRAPEGASAAAISRVPSTVDGVALLTQSFADTLGFAALYAKRRDLPRHLVLGSAALNFLDAAAFAKSAPLLRGLVLGGPRQDGRGAAWARFRSAYVRSFPKVASPVSPALFGPAVAYYDAAEAIVRALAEAHASGPRLLRALTATRLDAPDGPIRLDRNRQAIVTMHLSRVEVTAKGPTVRTFRDVPDVEQSFGGYFGATAPPPTATQPRCHAA